MDLQTLRNAKRQHLRDLMHKPNVVAVGIGYKEHEGVVTDELAVVVSVSAKLPVAMLAPSELVPKSVGAIPTDVQEIGVIRAMQSPTDRLRPAPGGCSIGHKDVTAGTLGCLVYRGQDLLILSNNHVLADCNRGRRGDAVLQPGKQDGGTLNDQIAVLEDFITINFGGGSDGGGGTPDPTPGGCSASAMLARGLRALSQVVGPKAEVTSTIQAQAGANLVDCALARPLAATLVDTRILNVGKPRGTGTATLNMEVVKSGRSSGFTRGTIKQIDVTVSVEYSGAGTATFSDQLVASGMSKPGDSGSIILDADSRVVGLLFAGSDAATMINPIQSVLSALNIRIAQ